jgi:hypothetical protein
MTDAPIPTIRQGTPEQVRAGASRGGKARMRAIKAARAQAKMAQKREKEK